MAVILGFLAGAGLSVQTSINTRLKKKVGTPYNASMISFLISLTFLSILLAATGQEVLIPFDKLKQEPLWIWIGGICGPAFLTGNIILFSKLGSVQAAVLPVLGQIFMGLIIDNFALFYSQQKPLTLLRAIGALMVLGGVIIVSLAKADTKDRKAMPVPSEPADSLNNTAKQPAGCESRSLSAGLSDNIVVTSPSNSSQNYLYLLIWSLFGICTGGLSAVQTAVNGYLGRLLSSPLKATSISFTVGSITLVTLCIILKLKRSLATHSAAIAPTDSVSSASGKAAESANLQATDTLDNEAVSSPAASPTAVNSSEHYTHSHSSNSLKPWWMWTGGLFGSLYVLANVNMSRIVGTGMTVIILLSGTTLGGVLIDHFGLLEAPKKPINLQKILGLIIMLIGAAAIKLP